MFGVAVLGFVLSLIAFFVTRNLELEFIKQDFQSNASADVLVIKGAITEDLNKISALRALFETFPNVISQAQFQFYANTILQDDPSITVAAWIPRVAREGRAALEADALRQGLPRYRIRTIEPEGKRPSISPERDEYFPIFYSTDDPSSSPAYGLDLGSEKRRLETVEQARDGDHIAISPIVALHLIGGDRNGFFALLPVYRPGQPHDSVEDRRRNLAGFVQGVFQISSMIESILKTKTPGRNLDFYFFGPDSQPDDRPVYPGASGGNLDSASVMSRAELGARVHWSTVLLVGDKAWTLIVVPRAGSLVVRVAAQYWSLRPAYS